VTVYATPGAPRDGAVIAAGSVFAAFFTYASDGADNPYGDDYPSTVQERYRLVGAGTWTELAATSPSYYSGDVYYSGYPALAAGNYERQVRAQSTATPTWSAYSASAFFTASTTPAAPTFSAPAAGATVGPTFTVSWSAPASNQGYEVQVRTSSGGGGSLVWGSGMVLQNVQTMTAQSPTTGTRYIRLRIKNNGLWSAWSERQVTAAYVNPMTPTVSSTPSDPGSLGSTHALQITVTHPTPSGGAPTVFDQDIHVRQTDDPTKVHAIQTSGTPGSFTWRAPAATSYDVRVTARASDGRMSQSAWTTATAPNAIKGFLLHDPIDPVGTVRMFRYNDEGASENVSVESALIDYQGREYPVAEFGASSERDVTVGLIHSKGSGDARALMAFLRLRRVLCYRDSKGRKLYGVLSLGDTADTIYGFATSVTVTATDYTLDTDRR
jgi:hypothetical protein